MKVAYTGHRDFQLTEEIKTLIMEDLNNPAVDEVIVGGARGFDLLVGRLAREVGKPFILVLLYPADMMVRRWNNEDKVELFLQVRAAKEVIVIEKEYSSDALFLRNREMVELADAVMACWDGREKGGTYNTLNFALSREKPVYNIYSGKCERVYPQRTSYDIFCHDDHGEGQYQQDHLVSSLERFIYEECDYVGGKAVAAHENTTVCPYYLTVDYLARKMDIPYAHRPKN